MHFNASDPFNVQCANVPLHSHHSPVLSSKGDHCSHSTSLEEPESQVFLLDQFVALPNIITDDGRAVMAFGIHKIWSSSSRSEAELQLRASPG